MNTALFQEPLLEELRSWIDAQAQRALIPPALCRAVRVRDLREVLERQKVRVAQQMRSSQDAAIERMLKTFLQEEIEGDRTLAELAPHLLRWCAAHHTEDSLESPLQSS